MSKKKGTVGHLMESLQGLDPETFVCSHSSEDHVTPFSKASAVQTVDVHDYLDHVLADGDKYVHLFFEPPPLKVFRVRGGRNIRVLREEVEDEVCAYAVTVRARTAEEAVDIVRRMSVDVVDLTVTEIGRDSDA